MLVVVEVGLLAAHVEVAAVLPLRLVLQAVVMRLGECMATALAGQQLELIAKAAALAAMRSAHRNPHSRCRACKMPI